MTPSPLRKVVGLAGAAAGIAVAGTAATVFARRKIEASPPEGDISFGAVRGDRRTVEASDGLQLYAEVDEPRTEPPPGAPTVVFVHGFGLTLDSWHFQRLFLRDEHRLVLYDHRSHGRSSRSRPEHCTIDMLGDDLGRVVEELAPHGPVVLVGHSMGGMTILTLAQQHPEWFGAKVIGVALVSTCADGMGDATFGLPRGLARALNDASPSLLTMLARAPRAFERGRRMGSRYAFAITRRLAFASPVPDEYVAFVDGMLSSTPIEVLVHFYPEFARLDKAHVLSAEKWPTTTIICGESDLLTPLRLSRRMAQALPHARLVQVPDAGHLVMLECGDVVNDELALLLKSVPCKE